MKLLRNPKCKSIKVLCFASSLLVFFLFLSQEILSMDWPSPSALISRNFGWNDGGMPHLGVTFEEGVAITAAGEGELLFLRHAGETASRLPSTLGSWVALDHGDGIISIYSRFDDNTHLEIPTHVERGYVLGEPGISGWASRRGFYFQLFDRRGRRWINPALIVHARDQTPPPQVLTVTLHDEQGRTFNPAQLGTLPQGRYTVSVNAIARSVRGTPLAPYRIIVSINGREVGALNFETYAARDGSLMVSRNGMIPARQVFASNPAYAVADVWFSSGQTTMETIVLDIAGTRRSVIHRFTVQ